MQSKILSINDLVAIVLKLKTTGKKIGFTSGTFDLLHRGHVEYLSSAKGLCDYLIVGVNSDKSVKLYKDPLRPIVQDIDRIAVLAGLQAVDALFLFDDTNNNNNIQLLKPDVYIKAGDYDISKLSSASIVKSYGGEIKIVPFVTDRSSTSIINKISQLNSISFPEIIPSVSKPAIFVDRDGTIIELIDYLCDPLKISFIKNALSGLKAFQDAGYCLVMTTNQPGIGLGFYTIYDFYSFTLELFKQLTPYEITFSKVYFSPHTKGEPSTTRKPLTGMIDKAKSELNLDLAKSLVIGDSTVDIEMANRAGLASALVLTGKAGKDKLYNITPTYIGKSILEIATMIIEINEKS
jgi:D-glycero-beta-D-manno-heptose 1-phosphate adenylyltransferase